VKVYFHDVEHGSFQVLRSVRVFSDNQPGTVVKNTPREGLHLKVPHSGFESRILAVVRLVEVLINVSLGLAPLNKQECSSGSLFRTFVGTLFSVIAL
jgi:hypothetical protein